MKSTPDKEGEIEVKEYVAVMVRSIPCEPGTDILVKKLNPETTILDLHKWVEKYAPKTSAASLIRLEITKISE